MWIAAGAQLQMSRVPMATSTDPIDLNVIYLISEGINSRDRPQSHLSFSLSSGRTAANEATDNVNMCLFPEYKKPNWVSRRIMLNFFFKQLQSFNIRCSKLLDCSVWIVCAPAILLCRTSLNTLNAQGPNNWIIQVSFYTVQQRVCAFAIVSVVWF